MRWIDKGSAPSCLAERRREMHRMERTTGQSHAAEDWAPGDCAPSIRESLHRDQRGLCGYCMQRIGKHGCLDLPEPVGNRGMRIEHIVARACEPSRMYDWDNLLGVCCGRSGSPSGAIFDHCDRSRGSHALHIDPTHRAPDPEAVLSYQRCAETDGLLIIAVPPYDGDVARLNLNNPALARRRRDAEKAVASVLSRSRLPADRRRRLERMLAAATTPDAQGELPEFAPVVARYIRRKLGQ
jgi:uncharacterized protein (TIGR02646 family)